MQDHGTVLSAEDTMLLLPWHGAGTLSPPLARRVEARLGGDATLKHALTAIKRERDGIVALHETLGVPSPRALASLFALIDLDIAAREKST